MDEFKRLSGIIIRQEALHRPTKPFVMAAFHEPDSIETLKVMSDADIGGYSKAEIDWIPPATTSETPTPSQNLNGHIRFHGNISIDLPADRPKVERTGYAAFRTRDRGPTIFGKSLWNTDHYAYLAMRIKSDGRKYFVNLQTESIVPTDIHQHRLYARRPGEWETVLIKWNQFVRTNHGAVVEPQDELLRQKVKSVGIGSIDRVPGPFELCVERIWASNGLGKDEIIEDGREEESHLKTTHGKKIKWSDKK